MHKSIQRVTNRIIERSKSHRQKYLQKSDQAHENVVFRKKLPCSNLAHTLAGCSSTCRTSMLDDSRPNIAIISSYNDLVSAHQPYGQYPEIIKAAVEKSGGTAQFAGGVPAMCDGVTQGQAGMDMSLMSRDVIAMSTVIGLSHNVFDGALLLGVCDKILPGLLMGALQFGHLPMMLIPAGPMTSGIVNAEKNKVREAFARGETGYDELLASEVKAYHSPGTCTFYGTANSNQLMAEMLGMHLPGSSFVNSGTKLRDALTKSAAEQITTLSHPGGNKHTPIAHVISEKSVVNAMVGLMATGGSTNETMHLTAIARAAGICIDWDDFQEISDNTPLLVRIYPNGRGDINSFQKAGGMAILIKELLQGGLLHEDVQTVIGKGFKRYTQEPVLENTSVHWHESPDKSHDSTIISTVSKPFETVGGIKVLSGNLGRAIMKISALANGDKTFVKAPAMVFNSQQELEDAFDAGKLNRDMIAVVRFQGPRAIGMPELHKLITLLSITMDRGHTVGLVTDGRLSGASGKVPFAIHCTPEAMAGGLLNKVQDGDTILMDAHRSILELQVEEAELNGRTPFSYNLKSSRQGLGRKIFSPLRNNLEGAEKGASSLFIDDDENHL